jgi:PII-like signaling protein
MKKYLGRKKILRVYIDSTDRFNGELLWQTLLNVAKEFGLSGATVIKAVAGIGAHTELHTFDIWSLSQKLPIVIEIIDEKDKLENFLNRYDYMIEEGLVTMGDVDVLRYRNKKE